jgi:hypothetical protein
MKRYLDCNASDLANITKSDLLYSIQSSEGRIIISETIGTVQPVLVSVTNAEFAASQGADILLLNLFDVNNPVINGLPSEIKPKDYIKSLKSLTGRPIGINLEPVAPGFEKTNDKFWDMTNGRLATVQNALKAYEMGANFIVLTGNPGNGISNKAITTSLSLINTAIGNELVLIAGKMHAAGILGEAAENLITKKDIKEFVLAGADIILLPAPGTVPGISMEYIRMLIAYAHGLGVLTMTAIGTSQEGADAATIKQIALMCKMAGTDLHHIGDTGYVGMAIPENILTYSIAIRGRRHTYTRIASSINR